MRHLIAETKSDHGAFDLKYGAGGLVDIDFLAQYLSLAHAHEDPAMLADHPAALIARAGAAGYLDAESVEGLLAARRLVTEIMQLQTTLIGATVTSGDELQEAVRKRLAAVAGLPDLRRLETELAETRGRVREIFSKVIG